MLEDRRHVHGKLWNLPELQKRFGPLPGANAGKEPEDLDRLLYSGFRLGGTAFLDAVDGRFACVFWDHERKVLFLTRDWMGETPLHLIATSRGFVVSNTLARVRDAAGDCYAYRYARAFPQSKYLEIDLSKITPGCVAETCRYTDHALFHDFAADCKAAADRYSHDPGESLRTIRHGLERSIAQRAAAVAGDRVALLLSGGLDSLSVGLLLRALDVPFVAYTLCVGSGGDDVSTAQEFAERLGVEHRLVHVSEADILQAAPAVVEIADTYHLYNYFCSVGMWLLGRQLADDQVSCAFCGEAVNEALGDYHDWIVTDRKTGRDHVLQRVNYERMRQSRERLLYVWGQSHDRGRYNRQLGTGLAKHAASRMVKPFLHFGLSLECPYYDRDVLAHLVSLPADEVDALGEKPGLFSRIFSADLEKFRFPASLIANCRKVRFQDASERGRSGLTPVLLEAGYDQKRLIDLFNECFRSNLDPELESRRLGIVAA